MGEHDQQLEELQTDADPIEDHATINRRGINIGGNTVTQSTEHLPEDQRLLVRWLHDHARSENWEWADLVKAVGSSSTTWYRIWADKYRYPKTDPKATERMPIDKQCEVIRRYKRVQEQRQAIAHSGFVKTSIWGKVEWLCRRSFIRQRIGFLYGESQIGKTTCLQEYTRLHNSGQTSYVELPPAAGVQLMTRTIADALHVNRNTCFENLIQDVLDALDSSKLLILDEVHRVFTTYQKTSVMRCLDVLRYIHDKSKCGMVICGTNVFRDNLKQGEFFQYLKQLRRRGLNEVQLPAYPPRADLDLMADKFGIQGEHKPFDIEIKVVDEKGTAKKIHIAMHSEEVVQSLAKSDGFGKYIIRLQDAVELARNRGEKPTWFHFCKAHHIIQKMAGEDHAKEAK